MSFCTQPIPYVMTLRWQAVGSIGGLKLPPSPVSLAIDLDNNRVAYYPNPVIGDLPDPLLIGLMSVNPAPILWENFDGFAFHVADVSDCDAKVFSFTFARGAATITVTVEPPKIDVPRFNPNGQVMDYLRRCYTVSDKPFSDSQERYRKRWFFTDDSAPVFPSWHSTGALSWNLEDQASGEQRTIGEDFAVRDFDYGVKPARADGGPLYGGLADFQEGVPANAAGLVPADDDGIPLS